MKSEIQAIIFDKKYYSAKKAKQWLKDYDIEPLKRVHKTKNFLRYRINMPELYKRFTTKKIDEGIKIVLGWY
jgi:hypothetical protein